jgi:hypothetical protein
MKVLALLLLFALGACTASAAVAAPRLRVTSLTPLTIRGSGFRDHERITVVVRTAASRVQRRLVADGSGAFRVRFTPYLAVDPCRGSIRVVATGRAGSRATAKRECRPADPQAP